MRCLTSSMQRQLYAARSLQQGLSRRQTRQLSSGIVRCSDSTPSSSGDGSEEWQQTNEVYKGFGRRPQQQPSPADALQNTLSGISQTVDRQSSKNNLIMGTVDDDEKWRELDLQVNEYPGQRTFKAIGTGGADFVRSMTACVEQVVGTVHAECVSQRDSAKGNYISVTVGPVWVETADQVLQIYENMKADGRLRFFF